MTRPPSAVPSGSGKPKLTPLLRRTGAFAAVLFVFALGVCTNTARAQKSYPLLSGEVLTGDPIHFNAQGVVVKRPDGSFAPRIGWTNFTEAALKELGKDGRAKPFVDQFLEAEEDEQAEKAETAITVKPVPRLERANLKAGFGAIFTSPLSVVLLLFFWAANIYAAFEIALFRNYPWPLVCGIAAVVPVIGPVLFLCLPTYVPAPTAEEVAAEAQYAAEAPPTEIPLPGAEPAPGAPVHAGHAPAAPAAAPAGAAPTVYKRGQTTFNRRFFETKLANFLRVTPSEADKDLVIFIKSSRGEYTGQRVSRITPNEVVLLLVKGGASQDVTIPYTEISEVHVKHKDS